MIRYINAKTNQGVETLSQEDSKDYENKKLFWKELLQNCQDYQMSGHEAWISRRATKEWYHDC